MNFKRLIGLDNLSAQYRYGTDAKFGHMAEAKIPDHWVATTCGYCSVGCGMHIGVKNGKAVGVRGDDSHPVNLGKLCPKGLSEHEFLNSPHRATSPLLAGRPIEWDQAIDTLVTRFTATQAKHGPQSLGVLSTGQLVTEEFYTLGKLIQLGFKTTNYDGNTTLCMSSAVAGYKRSFGSDGPPGAYNDLEVSDLIILIGANIADNHPILCQHLEKNPYKTLIVVDPRVTKTAMVADIHLPIKPRGDIAFLNGMLRILIDENLIDRAYIDAHTQGFPAVEQAAASYTPAVVQELAGITPDQLTQVARLFGQARAPMIAWTMGVNHSTQGTETVNAICNLHLAIGKVGLPGSSPMSITGQCNAMGTRETGFTSSLPGYRKFESATDREDLANLWQVPVEDLPTRRGHAYPDIIEAILRKQIKALWIIGTNPLVSFPNYDLLTQALANLDFLVVQDGFHPTPTTQLAHLVLPAAVWGEKEGTYTNSERRVSKVNKAVNPPGNALSDFDIFLRVAGRLGVQDKLFPNWSKPEDAFNEWRQISAGRLCDYSEISYARLETEGPIQWPNGAARLYADGQFSTPSGKAQFHAIEWKPFPEQPNTEFPFILNTGRTVEHWHTRTKTGEVKILESISPRAWLEMNPIDAKRLKLQAHEHVDIISRRGRVQGVDLRVTGIIAPGQVFLPFHWFEFNANQITQSAYDPISREPNYKQCAVRVERTSR